MLASSAARYTASEAGKINLRFSLASGKPGVVAATTYEADGGVFSGKLETVSYNARFKVVPMGGTMKQTDEGIEVKKMQTKYSLSLLVVRTSMLTKLLYIASIRLNWLLRFKD